MNEFTQITKDKGLYKKILKCGEGELIQSYTKVILNAKGIDESINEIQNEEETEFIIDLNSLPKGCNEGLKTMKKGEISVFVMRADYGIAENYLTDQSDLIYYIEVVDILN
jgi:FKBP-type peptidyl-prolyl cis-trans isomerase